MPRMSDKSSLLSESGRDVERDSEIDLRLDSEVLGTSGEKPNLRGLYAISDEILTPYELLPLALESALKAGVKIFQLRDKSHSDFWLRPHALHLMKLCEQYGALFVLNDRLELARELNAPALHLGRDDGEIALARREFGGILGASSYGDLSRARALEALGVDYVAFGALFASPTKPHAPTIPLNTLSQAKEELKVPICAIGGISIENISLLKNADMHALISSLWGKPPIDKSDLALESWLARITHNAKALRNAMT